MLSVSLRSVIIFDRTGIQLVRFKTYGVCKEQRANVKNRSYENLEHLLDTQKTSTGLPKFSVQNNKVTSISFSVYATSDRFQ